MPRSRSLQRERARVTRTSRTAATARPSPTLLVTTFEAGTCRTSPLVRKSDARDDGRQHAFDDPSLDGDPCQAGQLTSTTLPAATVVARALLARQRSTLARLVEYEIGQVIGRGGFGVAHRAVRRVISTGDTSPCCVKFIDASAISSWHREAYFGELLRGVPHVVQLLDTFVHVGSRRPRHVLVTELAEHGSLTTFLPRHGAFPERKAKAQVLGIARATDLLHRMHAVHRDLTPNNIFVMGDLTLKLADFGIAKHIAYGRGVQNDAQNPAFVHHLMRVGGLRLWKRQQDVYQLGQLLAMLHLRQSEAARLARRRGPALLRSHEGHHPAQHRS